MIGQLTRHIAHPLSKHNFEREFLDTSLHSRMREDRQRAIPNGKYHRFDFAFRRANGLQCSPRKLKIVPGRIVSVGQLSPVIGARVECRRTGDPNEGLVQHLRQILISDPTAFVIKGIEKREIGAEFHQERSGIAFLSIAYRFGRFSAEPVSCRSRRQIVAMKKPRISDLFCIGDRIRNTHSCTARCAVLLLHIVVDGSGALLLPGSSTALCAVVRSSLFIRGSRRDPENLLSSMTDKEREKRHGEGHLFGVVSDDLLPLPTCANMYKGYPAAYADTRSTRVTFFHSI